MSRTNRRLALFLALVLISSLVLAFGTPGMAALGGARKIVVFREDVPDAAKEGIVGKHGVTVVKHLHLVNATAITLPADAGAAERALKGIKGEGQVVRIDSDLVVRAVAKPAPGPLVETLPWGVDRIDADIAWGSSTGAGVKVAIVDTGIDLDHPDLMANIRPGINTINPRKSPDDDNGHGTHVAGIVAALRGNGIGVIGVAPNAWLYPVKVLNRSGWGYLSDIIEGLGWAIDNGMQVVNESFGSADSNETFHAAIRRVYDAGIIQVAAAGNESGPVSYPAAYPETIAVTACDSSDRFAYFSNYGPEVDLIAPGVSILSTYRGGGYRTLSGTSMAAPHVTGTVALILQMNSALSPDQVMSVLASTAEYLPGLTPAQQGSGLVDAERAVASVP